MTASELPPPDTKRWGMVLKAKIVAGLRGGIISLDEACDRYCLSAEEFLSWQIAIDRHGIQGLQQRRIQHNRHSRPKPEIGVTDTLNHISLNHISARRANCLGINREDSLTVRLRRKSLPLDLAPVAEAVVAPVTRPYSVYYSDTNLGAPLSPPDLAKFSIASFPTKEAALQFAHSLLKRRAFAWQINGPEDFLLGRADIAAYSSLQTIQMGKARATSLGALAPSEARDTA